MLVLQTITSSFSGPLSSSCQATHPSGARGKTFSLGNIVVGKTPQRAKPYQCSFPSPQAWQAAPFSQGNRQGARVCTQAAGRELLGASRKARTDCACLCGSGDLMGKRRESAPSPQLLLQEDGGLFCRKRWNEALQL